MEAYHECRRFCIDCRPKETLLMEEELEGSEGGCRQEINKRKSEREQSARSGSKRRGEHARTRML